MRYDELIAFLKFDLNGKDVTTDTLAALIVKGLGHVPHLDDTVELPIGTLKVENMARQRITRLAVYLNAEALNPVDDAE